MKYEIDKARCIHDTGKAILVEAPNFDEPEWIPQSQIHEESEVYELGGEGTLIINESFAEYRGWL